MLEPSFEATEPASRAVTGEARHDAGTKAQVPTEESRQDRVWVRAATIPAD